MNRGCIPAKALLHAATLYREMRECEKFGLHAENISFDLQKIYEYKDWASEQMRSELEKDFERLGIDMIYGNAVLQKNKTVKVAREDGSSLLLAGDKILIAAGAKAKLADIPGMELPGVVTSEELLVSKAHKYENMLILGGGVIGLELATVFQALGTNVTVIEISDRLLPNMDREFSDALEQILTKEESGFIKKAFSSGWKKREIFWDVDLCMTERTKKSRWMWYLCLWDARRLQRVFLKRMFLSNWKMGKLWWMNFTVPACRESMR